jgi:hypothetical protein
VHGEINISQKKAIPIFMMILTLALPCASSGEDREPLFGTWRLNFAESTFPSGPPAYARVTCKIEPWEDGLKVIYDMVGTRGGVTHWEWTGRLDGKDYALEGIEEVVTNAYSRIGDHTYSVVFKVDGRITTTTRISISPNGKIMTVTSASNTAIYNKR